MLIAEIVYMSCHMMNHNNKSVFGNEVPPETICRLEDLDIKRQENDFYDENELEEEETLDMIPIDEWEKIIIDFCGSIEQNESENAKELLELISNSLSDQIVFPINYLDTISINFLEKIRTCFYIDNIELSHYALNVLTLLATLSSDLVTDFINSNLFTYISTFFHDNYRCFSNHTTNDFLNFFIIMCEDRPEARVFISKHGIVNDITELLKDQTSEILYPNLIYFLQKFYSSSDIIIGQDILIDHYNIINSLKNDETLFINNEQTYKLIVSTYYYFLEYASKRFHYLFYSVDIFSGLYKMLENVVYDIDNLGNLKIIGNVFKYSSLEEKENLFQFCTKDYYNIILPYLAFNNERFAMEALCINFFMCLLNPDYSSYINDENIKNWISNLDNMHSSLKELFILYYSAIVNHSNAISSIVSLCTQEFYHSIEDMVENEDLPINHESSIIIIQNFGEIARAIELISSLNIFGYE